MKFKRHGLSIGIERTGNNFFLSLKAQGKLTHKDYETITPMINSALAEVKEPKVKVFIDGTELEGWEPRGASLKKSFSSMQTIPRHPAQ